MKNESKDDIEQMKKDLKELKSDTDWLDFLIFLLSIAWVFGWIHL